MSVQPIGHVVRTMGVSVKRGAGASVDYAAAVTSVRESETHDSPTTQTAVPDGSISDVGPSTWTVDIDYNVSWAKDSFHRILREHAGEAATLTWEPDPVGAAGVTVAYDVTLVGGGASQPVGSFATATVSLPVKGAPRTTDPVAP